MKRSCLLLILLFLYFYGIAQGSGLRLPSVLGDHMVLQQSSLVNIWGWADPGEKVEVNTGWSGTVYTTHADTSGRWMVKVETLEAGGPFDMTITAATSIELTDIMLGEVWVCSGQSNMEWPLSRAQSAMAEIQSANYPEIRLFTVEKRMASVPRDDERGSWQRCTPEAAGDFSAVGYFFGKNLHRELHVPVGLINSSWGGTPSEAWTSREALIETGGFGEQLEGLTQERESELDMIGKSRDSILRVISMQGDFLNPKNRGLSERWMNPSLEDSDWVEATTPVEWSSTPAIGLVEGVVWARKHFSIPEQWLGRPLILELGPIDELDATYFNGRKVGTSLRINDWNKERNYKIPAALVTEKECVVAVRIVNTVAEGGLVGMPGQLKILPEGGDGQAVDLTGLWKYKIAYKFPDLPPMANPKTPTVLYNGMLYPLTNFTIKGAIWYQGEDNVNRAIQYRRIFPAMISDWRRAWDEGDFPFYFVQLAPYTYGTEYAGAELREAQFLTLAKIKNSGMVVTLDIGNPENIHPTNKREVGRRLALWALAKDYNRELVFSGPLFAGQMIEGNQIRVLFDHTGGGLEIKDGPLTHIEIAGNDRSYLPADARIDGNTLVVSHPDIAEPVAVRYGWRNTAEPNLYNKEGLPASSFCSDQWPRITEGKGER